MRTDKFAQARFMRWRLPWWQSALIVALAAATVLAVAIVATSLILIIAPIVLVAVLVHRFINRRSAMRESASPSTRLKVIDAEYEVIATDAAPDRPRPQSDSGKSPWE